MAIPSSGPLSAQSINLELARSRTAELSIDTAENGGYGTINTNSESYPNSANPAAYSEWYSYDHTAGGPSFSPILLGYDVGSGNRACNNFYFGGQITQYVAGGTTPLFDAVTALYRTADGTVFSRAGWYSDGSLNKLWNGSSFTAEEDCFI
jgi:hypothetical protein